MTKLTVSKNLEIWKCTDTYFLACFIVVNYCKMLYIWLVNILWNSQKRRVWSSFKCQCSFTEIYRFLIKGCKNNICSCKFYSCYMIFSFTFIKFCNILLSSIPMLNFSAALWSLLNIRNFGFIIWKWCQKIQKSISKLPSLVHTWNVY